MENSSDQVKMCRLFWDYYGPAAHGTATHFHHHLVEWIKKNDPLARDTVNEETTYQTGVIDFKATHSAAYCVLPMTFGQHAYRTLKAHRALLEEEVSQETT